MKLTSKPSSDPITKAVYSAVIEHVKLSTKTKRDYNFLFGPSSKKLYDWIRTDKSYEIAK